MTSFLEQLNNEEEQKLLARLNFKMMPNGVNQGCMKYTTDLGYRVYHNYSHDADNNSEFIDDYLTLNDYFVKGSDQTRTAELRSFMTKRFGLFYDLELGKYLAKHPEPQIKNTQNEEDTPTA